MVQSKAATVAAYMKELPAERRAALARLRALIRKGAKGATEDMRYGMPTYTLDGEYLFAFAAQKNNYSFYCCYTDVLKKHKKRLGKLDCGKSCVRFRKPEDLDLDVVADMVSDSVKAVTKKAGKKAGKT
ncbi:MAG: iron chaperone [Planctomycetota bacterium]|jgi:uncharacterized protein YdhG (YjbR/CyaY superfamily)